MTDALLTVVPQVARLTVEPASAPVLEVIVPVARLSLDTTSAPDLTVVQRGAATLGVVAPAAPTLRVDVAAARLELATVGPQGPAASDAAHDARDTLVHRIAETSDVELAYDVDGQLVRATTWTSPARTTRIRETSFAYTAGTLTSTITRQYDAGGLAIRTLTRTFDYSPSGDLTGVETTLS